MKTSEVKKYVGESTHKEWKFRKQHKDIAAISKKSGVSRAAVAIAINFGHCSDELKEMINDYYGLNTDF